VELDDVIDQMIAERVIHRHRRTWLVLFIVLLAAILVVWLLHGWDRPASRTIDTVQGPTSLELGRYQFDFDSATIEHTPKGRLTDASSKVVVKLGLRNIDDETKKSESISGDLLYLVTKKGDPVRSNGATCRDELNHVLVYGLPAEDCTTEFEVPVGYDDTDVEVAVVEEEYRGDDDIIGATDKPYWHEGHARVVVRLTAEVVTTK
jgi:hypothetical protein